MYQLIYWIGAFAKTISLLSLIILIPDNPYTKQLLSKGFLLLYMNEIILFMVQSIVNMFTHPQLGQYYPLSQGIMNIYYCVIILIVVVWLINYHREFITQKMTSMSIIVIVFMWMAVGTLGIVAMATKQMDNVRAFGELTYALGWMLGLLKFIIQYRVNTQSNTFGLGFIFLFTNIAYTLCQLLSKTMQQQSRQYQIAYNQSTIIFTILLGIVCVAVNIMMINYRKGLLNRMREIQTQNRKLQHEVGITDSLVVDERYPSIYDRLQNTNEDRLPNINDRIDNDIDQQYPSVNQYYEKENTTYNTSLNQSLLTKQRKHTPSIATTKYSTSFTQSIENY